MKTRTLLLTILLAGTLLLVTAAPALAQTEVDPDALPGNGSGMGFGRAQDGVLADYMQAALAQALDMNLSEIEALLTAGETHYTIALSQGITVEQFPAFMASARTKALELAAADGVAVPQASRSNQGFGGFGRSGISRKGSGFCMNEESPLGNPGVGNRHGAKR